MNATCCIKHFKCSRRVEKCFIRSSPFTIYNTTYKGNGISPYIRIVEGHMHMITNWKEEREIVGVIEPWTSVWKLTYTYHHISAKLSKYFCNVNTVLSAFWLADLNYLTLHFSSMQLYAKESWGESKTACIRTTEISEVRFWDAGKHGDLYWPAA